MPHAVAAVHLLREHPAVDPARVFDRRRRPRAVGGLAGRPDVTIRVYDADNHLFFPGAGPSAPAEYEPAQHMDPAVVAGIASWLASAARAGR